MGSLSATRPSALRELPERAERMASADLRLAETGTDYREKVGAAFADASAPFSLKELSGMLGDLDERQIARWKSGAERVQLDRVMRCKQLWPRMLEALARVESDSVEVETIVRIRRTA
jgi:hypothetical protein